LITSSDFAPRSSGLDRPSRLQPSPAAGRTASPAATDPFFHERSEETDRVVCSAYRKKLGTALGSRYQVTTTSCGLTCIFLAYMII